MGLLILDIQHSGKPHRMGERGAKADLDGSGSVDVWETEAELTPIYASGASVRATELGHQCTILTYGRYSDRHTEANALARQVGVPTLYIACHLNAGGGDYGLVIHDSRSTLGRGAAGAVVNALTPFWDDHGVRVLRPQQTWSPGAQGPSGASEWPRAYSTIKGIYRGPGNITALCFEPLFIDSHKTLVTPDGLYSVGRALAEGFSSWASTQE